MIDAVLDAVTGVLEEAGIAAFREFPARPPEKSGTCVIVGAKNVKCQSSGLGDYLGTRTAENGKSKELFGRRVELELVLEVFSPLNTENSSVECVRYADELQALMAKLPSGLKPLQFSVGKVMTDEELDAFRCECEVQCLAFFEAESEDEQGEFLDFILKGVVVSGNK